MLAGYALHCFMPLVYLSAQSIQSPLALLRQLCLPGPLPEGTGECRTGKKDIFVTLAHSHSNLYRIVFPSLT